MDNTNCPERSEQDTAGTISIEQYNREIDEAVARVERGEYYTHEEVERMSESW